MLKDGGNRRHGTDSDGPVLACPLFCGVSHLAFRPLPDALVLAVTDCALLSRPCPELHSMSQRAVLNLPEATGFDVAGWEELGPRRGWRLSTPPASVPRTSIGIKVSVCIESEVSNDDKRSIEVEDGTS